MGYKESCHHRCCGTFPRPGIKRGGKGGLAGAAKRQQHFNVVDSPRALVYTDHGLDLRQNRMREFSSTTKDFLIQFPDSCSMVGRVFDVYDVPRSS